MLTHFSSIFVGLLNFFSLKVLTNKRAKKHQTLHEGYNAAVLNKYPVLTLHEGYNAAVLNKYPVLSSNDLLL